MRKRQNWISGSWAQTLLDQKVTKVDQFCAQFTRRPWAHHGHTMGTPWALTRILLVTMGTYSYAWTHQKPRGRVTVSPPG